MADTPDLPPLPLWPDDFLGYMRADERRAIIARIYVYAQAYAREAVRLDRAARFPTERAQLEAEWVALRTERETSRLAARASAVQHAEDCAFLFDRACDCGASQDSTQGVVPAPVSDDLLPLQRFADAIMESWREGHGIDGGELQDIAEACGLIEEFQTTAPCGDECSCADAGMEGETQCYRVQPVAFRAMKAAAEYEASLLAERGAR